MRSDPNEKPPVPSSMRNDEPAGPPAPAAARTAGERQPKGSGRPPRLPYRAHTVTGPGTGGARMHAFDEGSARKPVEWFSAENIVAVCTAVLGVLASVGVLWYERRVPRRKRIGYRVQMDTPIGSDVSEGRANVRLGLFSETPDMADATLVLLRVENDGSQSICLLYTSPSPRDS